MNIIQFNEIIELLHSISDNSTANIIALVSVIISGIAVCSEYLPKQISLLVFLFAFFLIQYITE